MKDLINYKVKTSNGSVIFETTVTDNLIFEVSKPKPKFKVGDILLFENLKSGCTGFADNYQNSAIGIVVNPIENLSYSKHGLTEEGSIPVISPYGPFKDIWYIQAQKITKIGTFNN